MAKQHTGARTDDVTQGLTLVDVTAWNGQVEDRLLHRSDAVFMCFGLHADGGCALPLNGQLPDPHGVVLAVDPVKESHLRLARRYRQLVRPELPVSVFDRRAQTVDVLESG